MSLKLPRGLYGLIDDGVRPDLSVVDKARAALAGGAHVLQLRLEKTSDRLALPIIREVVAMAGQAVVIVNDRVDLAKLGGAQGVHLGADDVPIAAAREFLGPEFLVGATCRSLEDLHAARAAGADHAGVGPIFTTTTKTVAHAPLGLETFAMIARASPLPVVGIAGVTLSNINQVARAGAWCAAVASGLLDAPDISERAKALQAAFFA